MNNGRQTDRRIKFRQKKSVPGEGTLFFSYLLSDNCLKFLR